MKTLRSLLFVAALPMLAPAKLLACATCYAGNVDTSMTEGMNWAMLTLGIVITTVLAGFLAFLIRVIRRSEALEAARVQAAGTAAKS